MVLAVEAVAVAVVVAAIVFPSYLPETSTLVAKTPVSLDGGGTTPYTGIAGQAQYKNQPPCNTTTTIAGSYIAAVVMEVVWGS